MAGGGFEEVVGEADAPRFEERHDGGTSEVEIAFIISFADGFSGNIGLLDASDAGSSYFEDSYLAPFGALYEGEDSFVGPKPGEAAAQTVWGDTGERTGDGAGFPGDSVRGEVESVIVCRTQAGEDDGAFGILFPERPAAEKGRKVEALSLDEDSAHVGGTLPAHVTAVGGEDGSVRAGMDGAGLGFETTVEKFVERAEFVCLEDRFLHGNAVFGDERFDVLPAGGTIFHIAQKTGEDGSLNETVQGDFAGRGSIDPA